MKKLVVVLVAEQCLAGCYGTDAAALAEGVNLMPLNSRERDLKNSTPP